MKGGQVEDWSRHVQHPCAIGEVCEDVFHLSVVTFGDVPVHRGGKARSGLGDHVGGVVEFGLGNRVTGGCGYCSGFGENHGAEVLTFGYGDDVANGAPHQAGQRTDGGDEHPLVPHRCEDLVTDCGVESCTRQGVIRLPNAGGHVSVLRPDLDAGESSESDDVTGVAELREHLHNTAKHVPGAEPVVEFVEMCHAVEERDDQCVGPDRLGHVIKLSLIHI